MFSAKRDCVMFRYLLSQFRLSSSVCLSVMFVTILSRLKFSTMFLCHFVAYSSADLRAKFYGDHPRGIPTSGSKRKRDRSINIATLDLSKAVSWKQCKIRLRVQLMTNRKSYL